VAVRPFPGISGAFAGRYFGTEAGSSQIMRQLIADRPRNVWESAEGWRIIAQCLTFVDQTRRFATPPGALLGGPLPPGQHLLPARNRGPVQQVFSPDGARLACSSTDSRIQVWDLATYRLHSPLEGHRGPVTALAFSPGGRVLASGGEDQTVRLWDMENSREIAVLRGHNDVVLAVAFSPDGELVASTALSDRGVQLWDVQKKASRALLHGEVSTFTCMAFTRDSHTLITGDEHGAVRLWDVGSLKQKTMVPAHEGWVKGLAVSSTSETLVTAGNDGLVKVWDLVEVSGDRRRRQ